MNNRNEKEANKQTLMSTIDIRDAYNLPWWKPVWIELNYDEITGPDYIPGVTFNIPIWDFTSIMIQLTHMICYMASLRLYAYIHLYRIVNYGTVGEKVLLFLSMYIATGGLWNGTPT